MPTPLQITSAERVAVRSLARAQVLMDRAATASLVGCQETRRAALEAAASAALAAAMALSDASDFDAPTLVTEPEPTMASRLADLVEISRDRNRILSSRREVIRGR